MPASTAPVVSRPSNPSPTPVESLDVVSRRLVSDLHAPNGRIFWSDLLASAAIGWAAFAVALAAAPWTPLMFVAGAISGFALYRGLCFTHELTHMRKRSVPGFETAWNVLFGMPLLLPSFTYMGVHQLHHGLTTYGTKADPVWERIAQCETGGNWAMQGPLWSGGLGIYHGTWDDYGGRDFASSPGLATREEQIMVAERIRHAVGLSAWGCAYQLGIVK